MPDPVVLAAVPEDFNFVAFGAVGRKEVQGEEGGPGGVAVTHGAGLVNGGVVENEDGGTVDVLGELN